MGYFFFDDSIHPRGGFAIGAFAYSSLDPSTAIAEALKAAGLTPGLDEFKSGARMDSPSPQRDAREQIRQIAMSGFRAALVVVPESQRSSLGSEALRGLGGFLDSNGLRADAHEVFLDGGLFKSKTVGLQTAIDLGLAATCNVHPEVDSRSVMGIQVADLFAHSAAVMLLEQLGLVTKTVKAGENSGYDPDSDIEIGFELWAGLRYHFFGGDVPHPDTWKSQSDCAYPVEPYGLYVSPLCGATLAAAVRSRFGEMYVGCIH